MSDNSNNKKEKNGISFAWNLFKITLKVLFPSYLLIQMNRYLSKVSRFYSNPWFKKQITRNYIMIVLLTSMFIAPLTLGALAIKGNKDFNGKIQSAKHLLYAKEFKKSVNEATKAFTDKKFIFVVKTVGGLTLLGLIVSNLLIFHYHDLIKDSNKLAKVLKNEGVIDRENKHPIVLFTPIGVLIDISGSAPKEIAHNERIWMAMNIQVKDWAEDPDKRSLVFFKTAFKLKSKYDYTLK